MIEYISPGLYFEDFPADQAIVPVATATAGFVGYAPYTEERSAFGAAAHTPLLVTSWPEFCSKFGDRDGRPFLPGCYLAHAVHGFFENGGTRAFVVRVPLPAGFERGLRGEGPCLTAADTDELIGTPLPALPRSQEQRRGLTGLLSLDEIALVAVPDLMAGLWERDRLRPNRQGRCPYCSGLLNGPVDRCPRCKRHGREVVRKAERDARLPAIRAAQTRMVDYCDQTARDRIAILDPIPGQAPLEARQWVAEANYPCDYGHAVLYYPWVQVQEPLRREDRMVPPSGHVAGVWARNDEERGVHRAPANLPIEGALDVEQPLTEGEQQMLNPFGINCIRAFPGRGINVWGARTLSSQPSWRYLNVRRLMTFIEKSIEQNTQWVVFEPNEPVLWERLARFIEGFLTKLWRDGSLAGATPEQAFIVKCDEETNPEDSVRLGRIITEVYVAPLKPAEYISFRIQQSHGTTTRS